MMKANKGDKMIHDLRIERSYLGNLLSGRKKVEIRLNDRDYQNGDTLRYKDYWDKSGDVKEYLFEITHIHSGTGMEGNYVALSIRQLTDSE